MKIPCPRCGGTGCVDQEDPLEQRRARLIELAHQWGAEHDGQPPTAKGWKTVKGTPWPSYITCIRAFGSWDQFILACGWEPRRVGRPLK